MIDPKFAHMFWEAEYNLDSFCGLLCYVLGKVFMESFNVVLFDKFEVLDVFGLVEVIGKLPNHYSIEYYALYGGSYPFL